MEERRNSRKSSLKMKITAAILAGAAALPLSFSMLPAPQAEAGPGDILGALIYAGANISEGKKQIHQMNDTEEGRQALFQALKDEYGVNYDYALNTRLDTIMTNLTAGVGAVDPTIYDKPYNYFINNMKEFNAFCTLGHNLSVNTGAFSTVANDDELAFVLAHEMGHGQKNHPARGFEKSVWAKAAGMATGMYIGAVAAAVYDNTQNTKPQEKEADKLAFEYITHTDYNPGAGAALWQRVYERQKSGSTSVERFISDHPSDESRRDTNEKYVSDYSGGHVTAKDGTVYVNGEMFVKPAPQGDMSTIERSFFVEGNLAAAYHNNHSSEKAYADGRTVMLGAQPIITCNSQEDESVSTLVDRLNNIKDKKISTKKKK